MTEGVALERIKVSFDDYQALTHLITTYINGYDDFHDGKLSKATFRKLFDDLFTKDIIYGYDHRQFSNFRGKFHGSDELWKFLEKDSFVTEKDIFHLMAPISITKYGINPKNGYKEATFRMHAILSARVKPKDKLLLITEAAMITARFSNGKWKICRIKNEVTSLKPGALKPKL